MKPPAIAWLTLFAAVIGGVVGNGIGWYRASAAKQQRDELARAAAHKKNQAIAVAIADLVAGAEAVEVARPGKSEVRFTDPRWNVRVADVLRAAEYTPHPPCLCVSTEIRLYRGANRVGTFSVHHTDQVRVWSGPVSGIYVVAADTVSALSKLIQEKTVN